MCILNVSIQIFISPREKNLDTLPTESNQNL